MGRIDVAKILDRALSRNPACHVPGAVRSPMDDLGTQVIPRRVIDQCEKSAARLVGHPCRSVAPHRTPA
ncbi:hypothetical protein GIS00_09155 [Nakamurella sp. YIM 132087]|uniref:Uncharacterized protein n=1 Tax=Nakamurella alba TaxID=2665158 RepID=A0A7K1FJ11_9ACTN|nr:hypothetical protein [Nakamurella alba]MTD14111.1 hypothetical protein [Nakamurella alba]